jgi:hypothetical protein
MDVGNQTAAAIETNVPTARHPARVPPLAVIIDSPEFEAAFSHSGAP